MNPQDLWTLVDLFRELALALEGSCVDVLWEGAGETYSDPNNKNRALCKPMGNQLPRVGFLFRAPLLGKQGLQQLQGSSGRIHRLHCKDRAFKEKHACISLLRPHYPWF